MCETHDPTGEPDAGEPPVRFGERRLETEPWRGVRHRHCESCREQLPPSAYRYRASYRLYSIATQRPLRHSVRAGLGIWGSICARAKGGSFTPSGSLARWRSLLTLVLTLILIRFSTPSAFRRSLLPRSRVTLSRRLYSAVEHRRPGHRSSGRRRVTAWCFVRSAASRKRSWLRACVYGATGRCRLDRAEERPPGMRSRAGRRRRRCLGRELSGKSGGRGLPASGLAGVLRSSSGRGYV